jgi:hypothetical protein
MSTSFARDVAPFLAPYRDNMIWRFDLTDYETVKANAALIYGQISPAGESLMPPPPVPPIRPSDIALFNSWMTEGCPP